VKSSPTVQGERNSQITKKLKDTSGNAARDICSSALVRIKSLKIKAVHQRTSGKKTRKPRRGKRHEEIRVQEKNKHKNHHKQIIEPETERKKDE